MVYVELDGERGAFSLRVPPTVRVRDFDEVAWSLMGTTGALDWWCGEEFAGPVHAATPVFRLHEEVPLQLQVLFAPGVRITWGHRVDRDLPAHDQMGHVLAERASDFAQWTSGLRNRVWWGYEL